ncbi:hypothetical protein AMTR_s00133p00052350 [Amborella trichopoda]|uniref:Glucose/Sorbosone dehydrogenase domain-containing protein n=3 Tax=Amborella trichopoda TaxID=13333 RepID=W1P9W9_AMBTC|nr:hypothetical protein AMTR_s00133p00052350 [Amborella trichopoda]
MGCAGEVAWKNWRMGVRITMADTLFIGFLILLLVRVSSALPLCTDSRAPLTSKASLSFCPYNGTICCNTKHDSDLQKQFESMNVSDPSCASLLKQILCAKCDQFSAELFDIKSGARPIPVLCNSTVLMNSSQSNEAAQNYCSKLWRTCENISVWNSPFAPSLQGPRATVNSTPSKITDFWQSEKDFCNAFGGASSDGHVCFEGGQISLNMTQAEPPPQGLCVEKIGNGSYLNMVAHPDGSNRVFVSSQDGKIWLATVPKVRSGSTLELDVSSPFLDISDILHFDAQFGLMGLAFHPNFVNNGRFFVSFNCDKTQWSGCVGRCSCNSDVNCDPTKLGSDGGSAPCQYHSVIVEYTANGTSTTPSQATTANPSEMRRIFTMGLPYTSHHGGQILFGPEDGYLYFMMGDGGNRGDPFNFAQNKMSLLGKIMRLDVDKMPSATEIDDLRLWGNYSIPKDNPFSQDNKSQPEIWALGLRNPWRCSFDLERPSYFVCADVGQEFYEEVDLITKGGNYGWRVYEGYGLFTPIWSPGGNTSTRSINAIFPVMGYNHSAVNIHEGSASIIGGYFYRSTSDPCMNGRYLYADLYAGALWAGLENPTDSGNFNSALIPFNCASDSPIPCTYVPASTLPALNYIFSFGEDNSKDLYLLAANGVYRVVAPSRCNYTCSKEVVTPVGSLAPSPSPSSAHLLFVPLKKLCLLLLVSPLLLW